MRSRPLALSVAALALGLLAHAAPAEAYCRTASCGDAPTGARCVPAQDTDCGVAVKWGSPCVSFSLQQDASVQVPLEAAQSVFETAFNSWMTADCGGGQTPRIRIDYTGPVVCDAHEYNQKKGNANIFIFRDDDWPHPTGGSTLALTTVTYNLDTGEIYDADMEINTQLVQFSVGDGSVSYDLLSVATHETGHFLGLSHSVSSADATMSPSYTPGSTSLRDLDPDDVAGICAIYPPGEAIPASCDTTPRHGYSPDCAADQPEPAEEAGGCQCRAPASGGGEGSAGAAFLAALGLAAAASRRRHRA